MSLQSLPNEFRVKTQVLFVGSGTMSLELLLTNADDVHVLLTMHCQLGMPLSPRGLCAQECVHCLLLWCVGQLGVFDIGIGGVGNDLLKLKYPLRLGCLSGLGWNSRCLR